MSYIMGMFTKVKEYGNYSDTIIYKLLFIYDQWKFWLSI